MMRKTSLIFGIGMTVVVGLLIYWILRQGELITEQQKKIDFLSSNAVPIRERNTTPKVAPNNNVDPVQLMNLDKECAEQALRTFNEEKARWNSFPFTHEADYESHYSRKHNKCFVLINRRTTDARGNLSNHRLLKDAYKQKTYAAYDRVPVPDMFNCWVTPDGDVMHSQNCSSQEEFEKFVGEYMND